GRSNPPAGNQAYYARKNMRERQINPIQTLLTNKKGMLVEAGLGESWDVYATAFDAMLMGCQGDGPIDALGNDAIREELQKAHDRLALDRSALKGDEVAPVGVD